MTYDRICLGGTFSPIHSGHLALLRMAFRSARTVLIGLTSDLMAGSTRTRKVEPYTSRLRDLEALCSDLKAEFGHSFDIREIADVIGFALEPDIEAIVVSEETEQGAKAINLLRREKGLRELNVLVVTMVVGPDGRRISSTSISSGEMDPDITETELKR